MLPVSAVHPSRIHSSLERHSCGWSVLVADRWNRTRSWSRIWHVNGIEMDPLQRTATTGRNQMGHRRQCECHQESLWPAAPRNRQSDRRRTVYFVSVPCPWSGLSIIVDLAPLLCLGTKTPPVYLSLCPTTSSSSIESTPSTGRISTRTRSLCPDNNAEEDWFRVAWHASINVTLLCNDDEQNASLSNWNRWLMGFTLQFNVALFIPCTR